MMARGLKRSLIKDLSDSGKGGKPSPSEPEDKREDAVPSVALEKASGGSGSAWKAGALAHTQDHLDRAREKLVDDILSGDQVLEIDPEMIHDPIGTDRRSDWMEQEGFVALVDSIKENGQDLPILVWPEDPDWRPDGLDPKNLESVQFLLLAGRRRREAARKLGQPVRAVVASQVGRGSLESTFNMLVLRFRENEQREDLSPFERLVSIGQMYEELSAASDSKVSAKVFATRIGVHESLVSRARAAFRSKDDILNAFKNVYDLSFRELQNLMAEQSGSSKKANKSSIRSKKLTVRRKAGRHKLSLETVDDKLAIRTSGVSLSKAQLAALGDLVADYLEQAGPN